ncbi:hypothetical protein [Paraliomyxa miuraensis]|uniref:hypothetical protein n=1 Tax=Paraliomyxa miuraensis TaxID=376150 RepID=UPI00224EC01E|nr:hypothetical protein [Paraliomyxa miuraensis]MCX4244839.1 hypothetical protein [Paraliomyxa miuraensis]
MIHRAVLMSMLVGGLALGPCPIAWAGKLGDMRSETQGSSSGGGGSGGSSGSASDSSDSSESGSSGVWSGALGEAMIEAYQETIWRLYTRYPYADGERGFVRIIDPEDESPSGQRLSGTFTLDGAAYSPALGRAGADFELVHRRFGLAFDLSPHLELRPLDALSLGSANALIAVLLLPRCQVYGGVGASFMIDGRVGVGEERVDTAGVNGTARITVLPARPVVLRGRVDFGRLGAAPAVMMRATTGVMIRRFEVFGGYEGRRVGDVVLHGPTVGTRVWF